jgi:hypothetical protein
MRYDCSNMNLSRPRVDAAEQWGDGAFSEAGNAEISLETMEQ